MTDKKLTDDGYEYTHKTTLTIYSNGDDAMVNVKVHWEPDLEGKDIEEIGFLPASYQFMAEFIIPAIEEGQMEWEAMPMLELISPSQRKN